MGSSQYTPRITFEVSDELKERTDRFLDVHGTRKAVLTVVLEDLLDLIEEHGRMAIGAILDAQVKPREVLRSMAKAERRCGDG